MNVIMECEVTLSNKLKDICEEGEPISIHINPLKGNKSRALVRIVAKEGVKLAAVSEVGQTSLMFRVAAVDEDIKRISTEKRFTSFFAGGDPHPAVGYTSPDTLPQGQPTPKWQHQDEFAEEYPPEPTPPYPTPPHPIWVPQGYPAGNVPPQNQPYPSLQEQHQRSQYPRPNRQHQPPPPRVETIMSYEELTYHLSQVDGINAEIPKRPEGIRLSRQQAIALDASVPRIRKRVFISNELSSQLLIADLMINAATSVSIAPRGMYDLTRVPAKFIRDSVDLKWCVETGRIKFRTYDEFINWGKATTVTHQPPSDSPLPVFDSADEAESFFATKESYFVPISSQHDGMEMSSSPLIESNDMGGRDDGPPMVSYEENPEMDRLLRSLSPDRTPQGSVAMPGKMRAGSSGNITRRM